MAPRDSTPVARVLGHPLTIAFVSALLAAIVLPPLTRGWQDRQKELELKRDLVTQLAQSSTVAVRAGIPSTNPGRTAARREWLVQRSVSNAIVATYFPSLADCWFTYSDAITAFLEMRSAGNGAPRDHEPKGHEIKLKLEETQQSCHWKDGLPQAEAAALAFVQSKVMPRLDTLTTAEVPGIGSHLGTLLLIGRDGIIRRIVAAHARGYAHGIL
jgi:hypothetical protein